MQEEDAAAVAQIVAETKANADAGKERSAQKTVVGVDLIEGQIRDIECAARANQNGGNNGQEAASERTEGLKAWQVYWDLTTEQYLINSPIVVTPKGEMNATVGNIEAGKTYTAQVWEDEDGNWHAEVVTEVKAKEGAKSETNVTVAVVGDLTGPNQIEQKHVGVIVVSAASESGGVAVKIDGEVKEAKYLIFDHKALEEDDFWKLPDVKVDGDAIRVTFYTKRVEFVTNVEFSNGSLTQAKASAEVVAMSYEEETSTTVFDTINHSELTDG